MQHAAVAEQSWATTGCLCCLPAGLCHQEDPAASTHTFKVVAVQYTILTDGAVTVPAAWWFSANKLTAEEFSLFPEGQLALSFGCVVASTRQDHLTRHFYRLHCATNRRPNDSCA